MANLSSKFIYESDFSKVTKDLKLLVRQATETNTAFAQLNKTAAAMKMEAARSFAGQAGFAGFRAQIVDLQGATENFGQALMKNKLTMKEYFSEAKKAYKKDSQAYKLAVREVARSKSTVAALGDIDGKRKGILITPETIDLKDAKTKMQMASKQYEIFNDLVQKGSTAMVNWGKNTQWAGRQLTVGLTVPMTIFSTKAINAFREVDAEITRFRKVYGSDLTQQVEGSTDAMLDQIKALGSEFAYQYGIASKETIALAADLAAAGFEGQKLATAVNQTTRMMVLGEVDRQEAMTATLSLQTAFNQSSKELAQSVDFLNAVENQTSASLQDLTEAIPKTGPVIKALGGDIKDLSVLMTALREGGINAAEGANAIKSGMASLISPTKQATQMAAQFGIDLEGIVKKNKGQLMPLLLDFQNELKGLDDFGRAQLIEQIFGKYQFARISALFDNLNQRGSQTVKMIELMKTSADDLAKKSYSELKAQENSSATRFAAVQQQLTEQMIKVGADLAESVLPTLQTGLDILMKIVDGFNNLPAPIKSFAKIIGTAVTVAGPLLMLAGMMGNLVGNTIKFGMSIVNMFKRITGNPVKQLEILSDEELAARVAADQLTGSYVKQKTSVDALNKSLAVYVANLKAAASIAPPASYSPMRPPRRFQSGGIVFASNGMTDGRLNGYGGGDKIPALLEPGEFIINKESSAKHAPLLRAINEGSYGKFSEGYTPPTPREKAVSLKTEAGFGGINAEKAQLALSPEELKSFKNVLVTEDKFKEVLAKLERANIPGFAGVDSKYFKLGMGTDRAHFAALENLIYYTDEADKSKRYAAGKEFLFSTASDNTGINRIVSDLNYKSITTELERILGYKPGELSRILSDTRPIIVNSELRDFFAKIETGLLGDNPVIKNDLSKVLFQKSGGGGFSGNKASKLVGALAASNLATQYAGDPIATRKILEAQVKHSVAQTATPEEWNRIKNAAPQAINEIVDMLMTGKPLDDAMVNRVRSLSSSFTGRRLLSSRESLILLEARNLDGEISKLTDEQRKLLSSIPDSDKKALIRELGLVDRIGVSKQAILTTKGGRTAVRSADAAILQEDMTGKLLYKNAGVLSDEAEIVKRLAASKEIKAPVKIRPKGKFVRGRFVPSGMQDGGLVQRFAVGGQVLQNILTKSQQEKLESIRQQWGRGRLRDVPEKEFMSILKSTQRKTMHESTFFRGQTVPKSVLDSLVPGSEFSIPGLKSFSSDENVGELFASMHRPGGDYYPGLMYKKQVGPGERDSVLAKATTREEQDLAVRETRLQHLRTIRAAKEEIPSLRAKLEEAIAVGRPKSEIRNLSHQLRMAEYRYSDRSALRAIEAKERFYKNNVPAVFRIRTPEGTDYVPFGAQMGKDWKYASEKESLFNNSKLKISNVEMRDGTAYIDAEMLAAQKFAAGGFVGKMSSFVKEMKMKKALRSVGDDAINNALSHYSRTRELDYLYPFMLRAQELKKSGSSKADIMKMVVDGKFDDILPNGLPDQMLVNLSDDLLYRPGLKRGEKAVADVGTLGFLNRSESSQAGIIYDSLQDIKDLFGSGAYDLLFNSKISSSKLIQQKIKALPAPGSKKSKRVLELERLAELEDLAKTTTFKQALRGVDLSTITDGELALIITRVMRHRSKKSGLESSMLHPKDVPVDSGRFYGPGTYFAVDAKKSYRLFRGFGKNKYAVDIDAALEKAILESKGYLTDSVMQQKIAEYKDLLINRGTRRSNLGPNTNDGLYNASWNDPIIQKLIEEGYLGYRHGDAVTNWMVGTPGWKLRPEQFSMGGVVQYRKNGGAIYGRGLDSGGKINGYGGGDTVPAMLEPGEFIINKKSSAKHAPLLRAINKDQLPGFAKGNTGLQKFNQAMGGGSGMMMNAMFLPMSGAMISSMDGFMKQITIATVAIQGLVVAAQMAAMAQTGLAKFSMARNSVAKAASVAARNPGTSAAQLVANRGGGRIAQAAAASKAGQAVGALSKFGGMAASALLNPITAGVVIAGAAIVGGIMLWRKHVEDLAKDAKSMYTQATEMAKVYNIEIMNTSKALEENSKFMRELKINSVGTGKGQLDKDYAKAVTKDFGDLITTINNTSSSQQKLNMLSAQYASLIAQGFSEDQAAETMAEVARQTNLTAEYSRLLPTLKANIIDAASAMSVIQAAVVAQIEVLGTAEERVSALTAAYLQLVNASGQAPDQFLYSTEALSQAAQGTGDLGKIVEDNLISQGVNSENREKLFNQLFGGDPINWSSEKGQLVGQTIMQGIGLGMNMGDLIDAKKNLEETVMDVAEAAAVQTTMIGVDSYLDETISKIEENISAINAYYDAAINAINAEIRAIQRGAEQKQRALEDEADALNDRKDLIEDNTNFYLDQLEKEYDAEQYYQKQRETALGGLGALSQGDVFGFIQAQSKMASDASQFGREQAIAQIEDTSDASQKALDEQLKQNSDAQDQLQESVQDQIAAKQDEIAALQKERSAKLKAQQIALDYAKSIEDKSIVASTEMEKLQRMLKKINGELPKDLEVPFRTVGDNAVSEFDRITEESVENISDITGTSVTELAKVVEEAFGTMFSTTSTDRIIQALGFKIDPKTNAVYNAPDAGNNVINNGVKKVDSFPGGAIGGTSANAPKGYKTGDVIEINGVKYKFDQNSYGWEWKKQNRGGMVKYATGGRVVPGFGSYDKVPTLLTPGEFVVDKAATRMNKLTLAKMNAGVSFDRPNMNSYGNAQVVDASTTNSTYNTPIQINVTTNDPQRAAILVAKEIKNVFRQRGDMI